MTPLRLERRPLSPGAKAIRVLPLTLLLPLVSWAAPTGSAPGQPANPIPPVVASPPATTPPQTNTAPQSGTTVEAHLTSIDTALQKLAQKAEKPDYSVWITAGGALLGVVVGGLITGLVNFLMQRRLLTHQKVLADEAARQAQELATAKSAQERELASKRAELEIGNAFVQWQLKQLSELYGPLHALLDQSRALYLHMNHVLVESQPTRFRFEPPPASGSTVKSEFQIHTGGKWVRFRTLLHFELVYGQGYGTDDYFSEIVEIGSRMVKVIQEKAGYIRPEQTELSNVFGRYLAHYSVLKKLHDYIRAEHKPAPLGGDDIPTHQFRKPPIAVIEAAVFPRDIDGMVTDGFLAITGELSSWRAKGGSV